MYLKFLGRGSAFNVKEGNNCAYFKVKSDLYLLDCGCGAFEGILDRQLLENLDSVNVFITHTHSDHIANLSDLIYYCYYIKKLEINVCAPDDCIKRILELEGHREGIEYNFKLLNVQENNSVKDISIKPIQVSHYKTLISFGYLINSEGRLIWFSGDCNEVSDVIEKYKIDEFYQDTCLADFEGNPHTCLRVLDECIPMDERRNIYCMHIDSIDLIEKAEALGFNVVHIS